MKSGNTALASAIFLVVASLSSSFWMNSQKNTVQEANDFSAPVLVHTAQAQESLPVFSAVNDGALSDPLTAASPSNSQESLFSPEATADGSIQDPGSPIGSITAFTGEIIQQNKEQLAKQSGNFPDFNKAFVAPTTGHDLGVLENYNAVDITSACGNPVVASADGLVVPDQNNTDVPGAWNAGYGNFILVEHSFGNQIFTRYAHLEQSLVSVGDYVRQGQEIGLVGKTGDATGCDLHFEVLGAENPFAKQ